jgi:hypothetical protein
LRAFQFLPLDDAEQDQGLFAHLVLLQFLQDHWHLGDEGPPFEAGGHALGPELADDLGAVLGGWLGEGEEVGVEEFVGEVVEEVVVVGEAEVGREVARDADDGVGVPAVE